MRDDVLHRISLTTDELDYVVMPISDGDGFAPLGPAEVADFLGYHRKTVHQWL